MIDLHEPLKKSYSASEEKEVQTKFFILIHGFLLLYLALHNLIIPLVVNLFRGGPLLLDVHYWFLFHIPVQVWLQKNMKVSSSFIAFLLLGSIARLLFHNLYLFSRSWSMVSVYLSEISSIIFCLIIWHRTKKDHYYFLPVLGLILPPMMAKYELRPDSAFSSKEEKVAMSEDYSGSGCRGASLTLSFPKDLNSNRSDNVSITDCGFEDVALTFSNDFKLFNKTRLDENLRLYKLTKREGRFSWKFLKIMRVKAFHSWSLGRDLKQNELYLLKSPERRKIGLVVLMPEITTLHGIFTINLDTLSWRAK